jgi:hypothetical protein
MGQKFHYWSTMYDLNTFGIMTDQAGVLYGVGAPITNHTKRGGLVGFAPGGAPSEPLAGGNVLHGGGSVEWVGVESGRWSNTIIFPRQTDPSPASSLK